LARNDRCFDFEQKLDEDKGRHCCPDWDFLEVTVQDPEFQCCTCPQYRNLRDEIDEGLDALEVDRLRAKKKQIYEDLKDAVDREWVGLTDREFEFFVPHCENDWEFEDYKTFATEIEAKLKEKNT